MTTDIAINGTISSVLPVDVGSTDDMVPLTAISVVI
jgi:hypothetical protein